MASSSEAPRLSISHDSPLSLRITQFASTTIWIVFTSLLVVWDLVVAIMIALIVTRPLRDGHGFWLGLLTVVPTLLVLLLIGYAGSRWVFESTWSGRLFYGKPRFFPLESPSRTIFNSILNCTQQLELHLDPEGERAIRALGRKDEILVESVFHERYAEKGYSATDWPGSWQDIRRTSHGGVSYGESIRSGRWNMFFLRFVAVSRMVGPLALITTGIAAWLLANAADSGSPLHVVQFLIAAGFTVGLAIFVNYTVSFRVLHFLGESEESVILEPLQDAMARKSPDSVAMNKRLASDFKVNHPELAAEVESFVGLTVYPEIKVKPGYVESIRNLFLRNLALVGVWNALIIAVVVLLQWPLSRWLSQWPNERVDSWTRYMVYGSFLVQIGLILAVVLGFFVLSRFRSFTSILLTATLAAVLPIVITYVIKGASDRTAIISAVITAAIAVIPEAIAELVKHKPSAKPAPEEETASGRG
jgi:hypothetical protein